METTMVNKADEFNRARTRMTGDIRTVIADGEDPLKAAADISGSRFAVVREKFAEKLGSARARLADASQAAVGTARRTAGAADGYVHGNPWTAIGIAANRVQTSARGETQPTTAASECKEANNASNVSCLQPDRHVFIEVSGNRNVN